MPFHLPGIPTSHMPIIYVFLNTAVAARMPYSPAHESLIRPCRHSEHGIYTPRLSTPLCSPLDSPTRGDPVESCPWYQDARRHTCQLDEWQLSRTDTIQPAALAVTGVQSDQQYLDDDDNIGDLGRTDSTIVLPLASLHTRRHNLLSSPRPSPPRSLHRGSGGGGGGGGRRQLGRHGLLLCRHVQHVGVHVVLELEPRGRGSEQTPADGADRRLVGRGGGARPAAWRSVRGLVCGGRSAERRAVPGQRNLLQWRDRAVRGRRQHGTWNVVW